jgi:hypothetical protein
MAQLTSNLGLLHLTVYITIMGVKKKFIVKWNLS